MGQTNPAPLRPLSAPRTVHQRLVDRMVRDATGTGVVEWVAHQRQQGHGWESVSHILHNLTGHRVSHTSLARWGREWGL